MQSFVIEKHRPPWNGQLNSTIKPTVDLTGNCYLLMNRKVLKVLTIQIFVCAKSYSNSIMILQLWGGNCVEMMHLDLMKAFKYTFKNNH